MDVFWSYSMFNVLIIMLYRGIGLVSDVQWVDLQLEETNMRIVIGFSWKAGNIGKSLNLLSIKLNLC